MIYYENGNYKQFRNIVSRIKNVHFGPMYATLLVVLSISIFTFSSSLAEVNAQNPYSSGYDHGCDDAKISDPDDRYINQQGKGSDYHTESFMNGYYDGFDDCYNDDYPPSSTSSKGAFKIIVEVTNYSFRDIYGGITVSIDHYPDNLFKSAYGIYFPAKETFSKTFSFKSSSVPIGTNFEVNIDYGDDYNQYKFGENTPAKRAEVIQFNIP